MLSTSKYVSTDVWNPFFFNNMFSKVSQIRRGFASSPSCLKEFLQSFYVLEKLLRQNGDNVETDRRLHIYGRF